jgi:hypothetical protein
MKNQMAQISEYILNSTSHLMEVIGYFSTLFIRGPAEIYTDQSQKAFFSVATDLQ